MNRAAISVASNLAEGSSRTSLKDQAHFSQLAYSSLMELACQLTMAEDLEYLPIESKKNLRMEFASLGNKINALRNSQLKRAATPRPNFKG
jgi:four helix bundle protein